MEATTSETFSALFKTVSYPVMRLEIRTAKIDGDRKPWVFFRAANGYIYVSDGMNRRQLAKGGSFIGSMLTYTGDDSGEFLKICRNWLRARE